MTLTQEYLDDWKRDLRRLGCGPELAAQILQAIRFQQAEQATALLRRQRQTLLGELHRAGERVDLVDFLLYTLKNQQRKG